MNKQPVTPASHREMIRRYPITGLAEGWYFRQEEVSAGCFVVEGQHGGSATRLDTSEAQDRPPLVSLDR
jgi:hypothetical protein